MMTTLILLLAMGQTPPAPELGIVQIQPGDYLRMQESGTLMPPYDGSDIPRPEPEYGSRLQAWNHTPIRVARLREADTAHRAAQPDDTRSHPDYDCTGLLDDCPPEPVEVVRDPDRPWPDWRDSTSFFLPDRRGWLVADPRDEVCLAFIRDQKLVEKWVERNLGTRLFQPVLVVNDNSFLIHASQLDFFRVEQRYCPACVEVKPLAETSAEFRERVARKTAFMVESGILPEGLEHDTLVSVRRTWTWGERQAPDRLADIVDRETLRIRDEFAAKGDVPPDLLRQIEARTILNLNRATDAFIREWLLTPHLLSYALLIGPLPEADARAVSVAAQKTLIPLWVRFAYSEWDDMARKRRAATDRWIHAGWRAMKRRCPTCETWDDWYCGSSALATLDARKGRVVCLPTGEPDARRLPPNRYFPGDTSVPGQMYTWELRRGSTWGEYLENATPVVDLLDLVPVERQQFLRVIATAHELADRWEGS